MTVQFADNSEFLEAINLLVDLQLAICEDNEERADALRDALDIPLNKLSWEANKWLRGLSGDLDMLCDQEVFEPNSFSEAEYQGRLLTACQNIETNPEEVLTLLRKEQNYVSPDVVAYFRGRAYSLLGFDQLGSLFLYRAVELAPDKTRYKAVLLGNSWFNRDLKQAKALFEFVSGDEGADSTTILLAAGFMFRLVKNSMPPDRETLGKIRQKAAKLLRSPDLLTTVPNIAGFGFVVVGAISELLNRKSEAYRNYSQACLLMPGDATSFLLRGRLVFQNDEQRALADFRHAIDLGISDPFPYLILAREALKAGDYAEANALCLSVLKIGGPLVQGQAYEFMAIAEAQAHGETDLAQKYFNEARRLFPSDNNIQKNQAIFEQVREQQTGKTSITPTHVIKYQFDLQEINEAMQNPSLDLMAWTKSNQLWADANLISPPLNTRLSIAA